MDLVFKRYSNPLFFLDIYIEKGEFLELVDFLIEQKLEDKWWELYLATLPLNDKSYEDWKKESQGNKISNNNSNYSKDDVDTIVKNSQNILSGFKPPQ